MKRLVRYSIIIIIGLVLVAGLTHCSLKSYTQKHYTRAQQEKPYDVIIVPGVPFDHEKTTDVMKMRVYWAKHLYDSGFTKNIIFSGSAVYTPYVESKIMKMMADSLGIPGDRLFAETKAEHSTENAYYSFKMAKELGFKKIALASDPFQSLMLGSFLDRYCPGVKSIPLVFGKLDITNKELPPVHFQAAYVDNFVSIKDRESFIKRFRGTMGKRVKDEVKAEKKEAKKARRVQQQEITTGKDKACRAN